MSKSQAERLYDSGKEPTVRKLLELDSENSKLKEKIVQLEKNSKDSSKPPSSDAIRTKEQRRQSDDKSSDKNNKPTRKAGGQKGHKGVCRELIPTENVNEVVHYYSGQCKNCHKELVQDEKTGRTDDLFRWQIFDIKEIEPYVIEYQSHSTICECGYHNTAEIPPEILSSAFGENLMSLIAYITAVLHVSRRGIQEFCLTFLNLKICLGSIQNILEYTSSALETPVNEIKESLPDQAVLNADETGWRDQWLWIFVASSFMYFHVAKYRSSKVLEKVLGQFYKGILCVDRWGAYSKYHKGLIQFCWAHLKRDFLGVLKIGISLQSKDAILFAKVMERLRKRMMAIWYQYKEGKISREQLIEYCVPIIRVMKMCLAKYEKSEDKNARKLAKSLSKHSDKLFTFIYHPGVEPTNNISERGIRPAVQWRKVCFGNRSEAGAILTSRLLTAVRTCWLQERNSLKFLAEAIRAYRYGNPAPSLIM